VIRIKGDRVAVYSVQYVLSVESR